jgi:hypothetical protein
MPYPTPEEFKEILRCVPLEKVVEDHVFQGIPYVFRESPQASQTLSRHLSVRLGVRQDDIVIIGSAKIGFSLDPDNFPRQFGRTSDIDVIIVDESKFDGLWHAIQAWHYARLPYNMNVDEKKW